MRTESESYRNGDGSGPRRVQDGLLLDAQELADELRLSLRHVRQFLSDLLAAGPLLANDVLAEAEAARVSKRTLLRACNDMGGKPKKTSQRHWEWSLPAPPTQGTFGDGGHPHVETPANEDEEAARNGEDAQLPEDAPPSGCGESDDDADREEAGDA